MARLDTACHYAARNSFIHRRLNTWNHLKFASGNMELLDDYSPSIVDRELGSLQYCLIKPTTLSNPQLLGFKGCHSSKPFIMIIVIYSALAKGYHNTLTVG